MTEAPRSDGEGQRIFTGTASRGEPQLQRFTAPETVGSADHVTAVQPGDEQGPDRPHRKVKDRMLSHVPFFGDRYRPADAVPRRGKFAPVRRAGVAATLGSLWLQDKVDERRAKRNGMPALMRGPDERRAVLVTDNPYRDRRRERLVGAALIIGGAALAYVLFKTQLENSFMDFGDDKGIDLLPNRPGHDGHYIGLDLNPIDGYQTWIDDDPWPSDGHTVTSPDAGTAPTPGVSPPSDTIPPDTNPPGGGTGNTGIDTEITELKEFRIEDDHGLIKEINEFAREIGGKDFTNRDGTRLYYDLREQFGNNLLRIPGNPGPDTYFVGNDQWIAAPSAKATWYNQEVEEFLRRHIKDAVES